MRGIPEDVELFPHLPPQSRGVQKRRIEPFDVGHSLAFLDAEEQIRRVRQVALERKGHGDGVGVFVPLVFIRGNIVVQVLAPVWCQKSAEPKNNYVPARTDRFRLSILANLTKGFSCPCPCPCASPPPRGANTEAPARRKGLSGRTFRPSCCRWLNHTSVFKQAPKGYTASSNFCGGEAVETSHFFALRLAFLARRSAFWHFLHRATLSPLPLVLRWNSSTGFSSIHLEQRFWPSGIDPSSSVDFARCASLPTSPRARVMPSGFPVRHRLRGTSLRTGIRVEKLI
ncbi:MAG: hypothetical protein ACI9UA_004902 [Pseudoalteromonas tetraodonis]